MSVAIFCKIMPIVKGMMMAIDGHQMPIVKGKHGHVDGIGMSTRTQILQAKVANHCAISYRNISYTQFATHIYTHGIFAAGGREGRSFRGLYAAAKTQNRKIFNTRLLWR